MNDVQTWSVIGVLAATLGTLVIGMFTLFSRTLKAEFGAVRAEIAGLRGEMEARFDAVDTRFNAVDARIDTLDRDVQNVVNRCERPPR